MRAPACADIVVRRLAAEFAGIHPPATVAAVVAEAVLHLSGQASPAALPELLERLARHRLDIGRPTPAEPADGRRGPGCRPHPVPPTGHRPQPAAAPACRPTLSTRPHPRP